MPSSAAARRLAAPQGLRQRRRRQRPPGLRRRHDRLGRRQGVFHSDDFAAQARQALPTSPPCCATAGAKPEHIVRMTWYVTDKREYLAAGREIGQRLSRDHRLLRHRHDRGRGQGADRGPRQGRDRGHRGHPRLNRRSDIARHTMASKAKASFHWDDPLLLDQQLTDDERAVRDAAARLLPGAARAARARGLPPRADRPGDLPRDGRARPARARPSPSSTAAPA